MKLKPFRLLRLALCVRALTPAVSRDRRIILTSNESAAGRLLSPQADGAHRVSAWNGIRSGIGSMLVMIIFDIFPRGRPFGASDAAYAGSYWKMVRRVTEWKALQVC